jgi:hypothetical protein
MMRSITVGIAQTNPQAAQIVRSSELHRHWHSSRVGAANHHEARGSKRPSKREVKMAKKSKKPAAKKPAPKDPVRLPKVHYELGYLYGQLSNAIKAALEKKK